MTKVRLLIVSSVLLGGLIGCGPAGQTATPSAPGTIPSAAPGGSYPAPDLAPAASPAGSYPAPEGAGESAPAASYPAPSASP